MSTEFLYREEDRRTCGVEIYSLHTLGSFLPGPRTLRPERLQWLTTSAVNRRVSIRNILWSSGVGLIAKAAPNRSIYRVDTVRSGALEELASRSKSCAFTRLSTISFSEISARLKAVKGIPLHFSYCQEAA